ncbi:Plasmatocyte-spreading peptide [Papilio machaon]|uniref:Plasmatocyte-spreading peptide n=1 Tax=Papilio machaon TaxID=76193 RepID=A0A194RH51_PAPMA|nr:growth-blocking peptide, long form [Papilio machaon]KPJ16907.1 Plasmatocyte-spreading peptide [Papilio machaon]
MKLSLIVLLCVGIVVISPESNGDVVVDLFGKIQESAQKIGDDIKNVFQSNNKQNNQYPRESVKVSKPDSRDADRIVFDRSEVTQASVTTPKGVSNNTKADPQAGRENFRGACATGYERTSDGRCKPTF